MITYDVLVDPKKMLRVRFADADGAVQDVAAVTCAYVPAQAGHVVGIAIQVVIDPGMPDPTQPYYCPQDRLQYRLMAPGQLKGVSPYLKTGRT